MCGICGIYNYGNGDPVNRPLLERMTAIIEHRGPDDEGFYINDNIGLGHRRLSIIDVEGGHQPLSNEDGTIWIAYNGEVYNFKSIREDLEERGHKFKTRTDTEVIVHAYEESGTDCVKLLNGIFAFAIWDKHNRQLFLARDHFGVKPLYYYYDEKRFLFGSELKAILCDPSVPREVDVDALNLCLTFRHTPSPFTLLRKVRRLSPGHLLVVSERGVYEKLYWNHHSEIDNRRKEEDWIMDLREMFEKAVVRQMISDVPIGISLSGGVDSGAIFKVMAMHTDQRVHAFTVGFEGAEKTNEIEQAKAIARQLGADFHEQTVKQKDYRDFFERYMWYLEEPVGNLSAMAYYFVAKLAHGNVKVLLNGQGADEPFAGYPRYIAARYSPILSRIPRFILNGAVGLHGRFIGQNEALKRVAFAYTTSNRSQLLLNTYTIVTPEMKKRLYKSEVARSMELHLPSEYIKMQLDNAPKGNCVEQMTYIDTRTSLPDNLLLCEDKMSMATSIEARVPYLDLELMNLVEQMPGSLKIRGLKQKYILKRAFEKWLPRNIVYQKKQGFSSPLDIWLNSTLGDFLTDMITSSDSLTGQLFNGQYVQELQKLHMERKEDFRWFLFLLLSIEIWHRIFVSRRNL